MGSYREALGKALVEAGEIYRRLVIIDADVAVSTRTIYFWRKFPNRFIEVGISEQDAIGIAAGLSVSGYIPIVVLYAIFMLRGWEQIRNTISRDNLNVKLIGTHAGLSDYLDGASHQCIEDIALMRILPNFIVLAPSDELSTTELIFQSLDINGPVYVRLGRDNAPDMELNDEIKIGTPRIVIEGKDLAIITYGGILGEVVKASKILKSKGINPMIVDMHTIKPLNTSFVEKIARSMGCIIVIEEHNVLGGLGSAIAEFLTDHYPIPILKIGINDRFGVDARSYREILNYFGLTCELIAYKVEGFVNAFKTCS